MSNLGKEFFSGVSYQVVGIVLALIIFDAFKEGVFLPIFDGIYHSDDIRRGTEIEYEDSGALVVVRGPFRFRIGYLVSRLLFVVTLLIVVYPCMWHWKKTGGKSLLAQDPNMSETQSDINLDISETPAAVSAEGKIVAAENAGVPMSGIDKVAGAKTAAAAAAKAAAVSHHHVMST